MAKRAAVAWVQTNVSDAGEARALARAVVRARLAACANVWPIESEYWWEGKVVHAREVVVHLKTSPGALRPLVAAVRRAHPYDVPYIEWGTARGVDGAYARWVSGEAGARPRGTRRRT